jgi:hypothetical protein
VPLTVSPALTFVVEQPLQRTDGIAAAAIARFGVSERHVGSFTTPVAEGRGLLLRATTATRVEAPNTPFDSPLHGRHRGGGTGSARTSDPRLPTLWIRIVGGQGSDLTRRPVSRRSIAPTIGSRRVRGGARGERAKASGGLEYASIRPVPNPADQPAAWSRRPMDRRDGAEEHLDGPLDDQLTLVGNLRDLRRLNRCRGASC